MNERNECDLSIVLSGLLAFGLPLTLLLPGFTLWDILPKVRVTRFHIYNQYLTWPQLNAVVISLLAVFFCLYLELKKRKLDDMVESVLTVSLETDTTMEMERERQAAAMRACVELLDVSAEHYEHLVLLRDELRKREKQKKHRPPSIETSCSEGP